MNLFTDSEKLSALEKMIESMRRTAQSDADHERIKIMGAIASDIRAKLDNAPTVALLQIERRLTSVMRHKTKLGYERNTMIGLAEEVVGRWPVVKLALERFGDS